MSAVGPLLDTPHPPGEHYREANEAPTDLQAYGALSEAADLVARAGRLLRHARQPGLGFHLSDIAGEIHTELRRCPYQPAAPQRPRHPTTPTDPSNS